MTGIYWAEDEATVKDYSALTKAGQTVLTVKIVVMDHHALGHMLRDLDKAMASSKPKPRRPVKPLLLTDQRGRDE